MDVSERASPTKQREDELQKLNADKNILMMELEVITATKNMEIGQVRDGQGIKTLN